MSGSGRKPITIRFRFNKDTGQIEEFLIDDGDRLAPEQYHNQIAAAIAGRLFRRPQIEDAGTAAIEHSLSNLTPEQIRERVRNEE
jgi:hypothetical protein